MTPGLTEEQMKELASHMSDPLVMAELATAAHAHPSATREEKATLILMALVARLSVKAPIKASEANKMGRIMWDQLKTTGWVTPAKVLETVLRTVEGFPPRTNEILREELLREQEERERRA